MTEGLAAQISSIVRRHLADAHRMLGTLLAQLDDDGADPRTATRDHPVPPPAKEVGTGTSLAAIALSDKPKTISRRLRKQRQRVRERQAVNGAPASAPKPAEPPDPFKDAWPELREEFRAAVEARSLSRGQVAEQLRASKASVIYWLSPAGKRPSTANMMAIRRWLSLSVPRPETETAPPAPAELAPSQDAMAAFRLSDTERDRLRGYLSLEDEKTLRSQFNCTRPVLEKAALGGRLNSEIVSRLRGALANGAA